MRYLHVKAHHQLPLLPDDLIGREAFIPKEAHLMVTSATSTTVEAVMVLIDHPDEQSPNYIRFIMNRIPNLNEIPDNANLAIHPIDRIAGYLITKVWPDQGPWTDLEVIPSDLDTTMRSMLGILRNVPERSNAQAHTRQHLFGLFQDRRIITAQHIADPSSKSVLDQVVWPESIEPGTLVVISAPFPTVSDAMVKELLYRLNLPQLDTHITVFTSHDPLSQYQEFIERIKTDQARTSGWLIELDLDPSDHIALRIINQILLPELGQLAKKRLVIVACENLKIVSQFDSIPFIHLNACGDEVSEGSITAHD